jgi:hypothetical protein
VTSQQPAGALAVLPGTFVFDYDAGMMGVAMIVRPDTTKPEIHAFEGKVPAAVFRRKALGGEGAIIPHFTTVNWDGAIYNCVAFHNPGERQRRNATAMMLLKQSFAWQDRKSKPASTWRGPYSFSMAMTSS